MTNETNTANTTSAVKQNTTSPKKPAQKAQPAKTVSKSTGAKTASKQTAKTEHIADKVVAMPSRRVWPD